MDDDGEDVIVGTPGKGRVPRKMVPRTMAGRFETAAEALARAQAQQDTLGTKTDVQSLETSWGGWMAVTISQVAKWGQSVGRPENVVLPKWGGKEAGQLKELAKKFGGDRLAMRTYLRDLHVAWAALAFENEFGATMLCSGLPTLGLALARCEKFLQLLAHVKEIYPNGVPIKR